MKNSRAKWLVTLDIKATCGDKGEPPSTIKYEISGAWNPSKVGALECLARDLANVMHAASRVLIPSTRDAVGKAFIDELSEIDPIGE